MQKLPSRQCKVVGVRSSHADIWSCFSNVCGHFFHMAPLEAVSDDWFSPTWRPTVLTALTAVIIGPLWIEDCFQSTYTVLQINILYNSLFCSRIFFILYTSCTHAQTLLPGHILDLLHHSSIK